MGKKYIVKLSKQERSTLIDLKKKLKASSQKIQRANVLLKADSNSSNWTDLRIAQAFDCRVQTVENIRKRFVTEGFDAVLNRKVRTNPPRAKILDGKQEAEIIALRLGQPPQGFANWSLRLLADKVVELGIVESVSYETVRRTLKKIK